MAKGLFRFNFYSRKIKSASGLILIGALYVVASCSHKNEPQPQSTPTPTPLTVIETKPAPTATEAATPITELVTQLLASAQQASLNLKQQTAALLAQPNMDILTATQNAWDAAAKPIEALTVFSYLNAGATQTHKFQYQLSAWPIEPGYLDTYGEDAYSGLVFEVGTPLTADFLRQQHGFSSERDATLGIYAIEFILFGENNERGPLLFVPITGLSEQDIKAGYKELAELPRNRRRQLLQLQTETLNADIEQYQQYWQMQKPAISDADFAAAALAMVQKQIGEVTELLQPKPAELFQNRVRRSAQLAPRLVAQLAGFQQILTATNAPNKNQIAVPLEKVLAETRQISEASASLGPKAPPNSKTLEVWSVIKSDLNNLATALSTK